MELKNAGFLVVVVTNQPDIANGLVAEPLVAAMHDKMRRALPIDAVMLCPHNAAAGCDCRKPKPGMLLKAAADLDIDLIGSYMVGDRISDVHAGAAAGCKSIFIDRHYTETKGQEIGTDLIVTTLPAAAKLILSRHTRQP
jgi:D-glycero-D-manno-heptose 1,7-bisphosphate phosphatase